MYIKKLTLKNYRNYKSSEFKFINGINILVGMNAQGKTNAAEAIFYLCHRGIRRGQRAISN